MEKPHLILRQVLPASALQSSEGRVIMTAGMLEDVPVRALTLEDLVNYTSDLRDGAMPVGTVEFVRAAMRLAGMPEPANISYPESLASMTQRTIKVATLGEAMSVEDPIFIKPVETKRFTGMALTPQMIRGLVLGDLAGLEVGDDEFDQLGILSSLPSETPVWMSSTIDFAGEWRYYVLEGRIVGASRYDPDGEEDVRAPSDYWVQWAVDRFQAEAGLAAWCLDVGRIEDGRIAVVEANDAWAIGLYGQALDARTYLKFLWARWSQLRTASR